MGLPLIYVKASEEGVPEKAKERNKQRSCEGSFIILVVSPVFYVMNF